MVTQVCIIQGPSLWYTYTTFLDKANKMRRVSGIKIERCGKERLKKKVPDFLFLL